MELEDIEDSLAGMIVGRLSNDLLS